MGGGGINNDTIEVWVVAFGALICGIVWISQKGNCQRVEERAVFCVHKSNEF